MKNEPVEYGEREKEWVLDRRWLFPVPKLDPESARTKFLQKTLPTILIFLSRLFYPVVRLAEENETMCAATIQLYHTHRHQLD